MLTRAKLPRREHVYEDVAKWKKGIFYLRACPECYTDNAPSEGHFETGKDEWYEPEVPKEVLRFRK